MPNKDLFVMPGRVHPHEYNWEKQFATIINSAYKHSEPFVLIDVGKLSGLCCYVVELENELGKEV